MKYFKLRVELFYPDADFTNLNDERLKTAIIKAQIVENRAHFNTEWHMEYGNYIGIEIAQILGIPRFPER